LKYQRETLKFSIKSDEADTGKAAIILALSRVNRHNSFLGNVFLGAFVGEAVVADTEEERDKAGIRDSGYRATYGEYSGKWYDAASLDTTLCCKECGAPLSPGQKINGQFCDLHEAKSRVSVKQREADVALVEKLGVKGAAKKLGITPNAVWRRIKRAREIGIPTGKKKEAV
jgi:hypothetical protein